MATRRCDQCGATVEVSAELSSTRCAFCDSPLVDASAAREPVDRVATFDVTRDRAGQLLRGHLQGSWMAPESVRSAARPESLRGVLVPFYAYDAVARTDFRANVGIHWYRTETYTTVENGKTVTRTRQVQETDWHPFSGSHGRRWLDHLVSASRGLPEAEANALEPFDIGRARPYDPSLVAGLEAEHPTVEHLQARHTADAELRRLEAQAVAGGHLPGNVHRDLETQSRIDVEAIRLVLLPVWIAVFHGPSGPIRLLVNGQTGEVVGHVPRSATKVGCLVVAVIAAFAAMLAMLVLGSTVIAMVGR